MKRRGGLILVGGPTGSGKTTTLHALMRHLCGPGRKLLSVEDPVETVLPGVSQVAVEPGGMGFASAVRAMLRHAPDVIMVGEIRDGETARASAEAALTGHLVLASVHARDAAETAARLAGLGVERHVTAAVLRAALSQRLVRRLCPDCRQPAVPPAGLLSALGFKGDASAGPFFDAPGCARCGHSGYHGRFALFEFIQFTQPLQEALAAGASAATLRELAAREAMPTLKGAAARAVASGDTSAAEAAAALGLDAGQG